MSIENLVLAADKVSIKARKNRVKIEVVWNGQLKAYHALSVNLAVECACIDLEVKYEGPRDAGVKVAT